MKRKAFLIFLSAMMLFFGSCADEPAPVKVEEEIPLTITGEEALPEEFKPLNEKAKADIAERYGKTALEFLAFESVGRVEYPSSEYRGCHVFLYTA